MKEKIKTQEAFIQIPILIGIIISLVIGSGIGAGLVLHKQARQASLTANVSEVFSESENKESEPVDTKEESAFQESSEEEIKKLEEIIRNQQIQIDELLSGSPEIKEIVKEVPVEKIVYKEICSCPQTQSEAPNEQFITYSGSEFGGEIHDYFPVITSFSVEPSPETGLKAGDEIHLKVMASDPQGRQILYSWWCATCALNPPSTTRQWTTNNEIRYRITSEDIKNSGESLRIGVYIKSEKEYYRTGSHGYDDGIYTDYKISF